MICMLTLLWPVVRVGSIDQGKYFLKKNPVINPILSFAGIFPIWFLLEIVSDISRPSMIGCPNN